MERAHFGSLAGGIPVEIYTLHSPALVLRVSTFGGRIVDLIMRGSDGTPTSVVLGFGSLPGYVADRAYMGALIGRYANRLAGGRFILGGKIYQTFRNDGDHSLHGGRLGFDQRIWRANSEGDSLVLTYTSVAGEEGFPGSLTVKVRYSLAGHIVRLDYEAIATAATPVNLTNHVYFNLSGNPSSTILGHRVTIAADQYTPISESLIPTGELRDVAGTPFDFRRPHALGERIDAADSQLAFGQGYDHNWVLQGPQGALRSAATVYEPDSGRSLEVLTTEPGLQFYSGNQLDGSSPGVGDAAHARRCGLCLETQHFPDSPNHPHFPSTILIPGQYYKSTTVYQFSIKA